MAKEKKELKTKHDADDLQRAINPEDHSQSPEELLNVLNNFQAAHYDQVTSRPSNEISIIVKVLNELVNK